MNNDSFFFYKGSLCDAEFRLQILLGTAQPFILKLLVSY